MIATGITQVVSVSTWCVGVIPDHDRVGTDVEEWIELAARRTVTGWIAIEIT